MGKSRVQKPLLLILLLCSASPMALIAADRGELSLRADPVYVSPNRDGLQDQAFFYPVLTSHRSVSRWRVDIEREGKGRQARLTGAGMPALIMWDVLDRKGVLAADGAYRARMDVWGKSLHLSAEQRFFVDATPPAVAISVSTPTLHLDQGGEVTYLTSVGDRSPIERWQLQILNEAGRTVSLIWSTGPARNVTWDAQDRQTGMNVASGRYRAAYQAWDVAGNQSEPAFVDLQVVSGESAYPGSTAVGGVSQLSSETLFAYRRGRIILSEQAGAVLADVAAWLNANPRSDVLILGYSHAYASPRKDRDLSSRYAWLVYSYLVKQGGVKASRIRVEGRGQDAKALSNGLEVVLVNAAGQ